MPPESATTALTVANNGTHGGTVISHTMMSPCWSLLASTNDRTTLAVPCAVPGEAATPVMMLGSVLGSAKVVRSLVEASKLQQGDIMVCEMTVPPWVPLFATVSAVVADSGGILSHCAIVAREFGLPAV